MAVLLVLALLALVAGAVEPRVPDIKSLFPSSVQDKEKAALLAVANAADTNSAGVVAAPASAASSTSTDVPTQLPASRSDAANSVRGRSSLQPWGVAILTIGVIAMAAGLSLGLLGLVRLAEKPAKGGIGFVESKHVALDVKETNFGAVLGVSGAISLCVGVIFVGVSLGVAPLTVF